MNKKALVLFTALIAMITLSGCLQQVRYKVKEVQSDVFGLRRVVTVYSLDGKPIKTIDGKFKIVYPANNRMEFINEDGKKTTVAGLYTTIIEEK